MTHEEILPVLAAYTVLVFSLGFLKGWVAHRDQKSTRKPGPPASAQS